MPIGGAPGGLGGPGSNNPNSTSNAGKVGGGGLNTLGKIGPYKKSKRKPGAKEEIGAGSATTQTNEMTTENALKLGANVAAHLAGPVGTLLNAAGTAALDDNPFGYEKPTGTTDQFSSDPNQAEAGAQKPVVVQPKVNKKKKPLLPVGLQLLAGMPGSLLGT